jgi:hypothetical protein
MHAVKLAPTLSSKEFADQVETLRSAVDRLAVGAARTETLLEEILDRPQQDRDQTTWYVALLAFGFAGLAIAMAMLAYLA